MARQPKVPPTLSPEEEVVEEVPIEEMFLVPKDLLQTAATILGQLPYATVAEVLNPILQLLPIQIQRVGEPEAPTQDD